MLQVEREQFLNLTMKAAVGVVTVSLLGGLLASSTPILAMPAPPGHAPSIADGIDPAIADQDNGLALARAQGPFLAIMDKAAVVEGFGGAYFDGARPHLNVTDAFNEETLKLILAESPRGSEVLIHRVTWTEAELNAAARMIGDKFPPSRSTSFKIPRVSLDTPKNRLSVYVEGDASEARAMLEDVVSSSMIVIVPASNLPYMYEAGRTDDGPPFYAGNVLRNDTPDQAGGHALCSSSAGMKIVSTEYVMTAAHCDFGSGELIRVNNFYGTAPSPSIAGTFHAKAYYGPNSANNVDAMLLRRNSVPNLVTNTMWSGSPTSTSSLLYSTSAGSNYLGRAICSNGGFTGTVCSMSISDQIPYLYGEGNIRWNQLLFAERPNVTVAGFGDSGGPVYGYPEQGSYYEILGPIHAFTSNVQGGWQCPDGPPGRKCGDGVVWSSQSAAQSKLGATIAP